MKITVYTNVLIRAVVRDAPEQASVAAQVLRDAELIAVTFWAVRPSFHSTKKPSLYLPNMDWQRGCCESRTGVAPRNQF